MQQCPSIGKGPTCLTSEGCCVVCRGARLQHASCPVLLPQIAAGALPLPAGRAPALPALGISSAGVQLRTARSMESLPNQAFCYLAEVTASWGR